MRNKMHIAAIATVTTLGSITEAFACRCLDLPLANTV